MFYHVEITDTFGGEANYSWVTRHVIRANSARGAMSAIARRSGIHWRKLYDCGDHIRYDSISGATCAFVSPLYDDSPDPAMRGRLDTDDRC